MMDYADFLASKRAVVQPCGVDAPAEAITPYAKPHQRDLIRWSLRKGRAAVFADTGLGKTLVQLEWARLIGERVLILAPLAVARQTVAEGERFGISVTYARSQAEVGDGITITNYEMLHAFDPAAFGAVVLDESSILKNFEGKTRTALIRAFRDTPYRLACTATPAPNDIAEMANHAEFLGVMKREEMLATYFVKAPKKVNGKIVEKQATWRLKGHAREPFYRWLASWAMSLKRPGDLGYPNDGYDLPPLDIVRVLVSTDWTPPGQLFPTTLKGIGERVAVRRDTLADRVEAAAELILAEPDEPWIAWVGLNEEGAALAARIPGAELVEGSQPADEKVDRLTAFVRGDARVMVTKPSIAGLGLNLQRCARMVFVGLSDSYEAYYQAIRRCWRYGQRRPVRAFVVVSEPEEAIYVNVKRKQAEAETMTTELVRRVAAYELAELHGQAESDTMIHGVRMVLPSWLEGVA
jgi:superfamily II DNA or RNA helicase